MPIQFGGQTLEDNYEGGTPTPQTPADPRSTFGQFGVGAKMARDALVRALSGAPDAPIGDPGGGISMDPALGMTIAQNPEIIAAHLAANGVPPPSDATGKETVQAAGESLRQAHSEASVREPEYGPEGQGAADTDMGAERPRPQNAQSPNAGGAVAKPTAPAGGKASSALDGLSKALAGLKPIPPKDYGNVSTPAAYHPANMISRSTLPSVLLQQLSGITKGTTGPYRLGQALMGVKNA